MTFAACLALIFCGGSVPVRRWNLCQLEMTLGHVRALARTIQERLGGFFYEYVDRLKK